MNKYLLPFVLLLIFSCGKEEEPQARSTFPEKYTFTEFDFGTTTLYEIKDSGFEMIPLSGSFVISNPLVKDEIKTGNLFSFSEIEFLDEETVNVTGGDGANSQTVSMKYQTVDNVITLFEDGISNFTFEKNEANNQLTLCYNTNWATSVKNNGDWDMSFLDITISCKTKNTSEIIENMIQLYPEADTVAINFSNDIFDLVE